MAGITLPTRRLVSQEDASRIQNASVPRSRFVGSWSRKTAFNAADLVPIMVDEVLPGDHLSYDLTAYVRMATPVFPLMDSQRIDTFFFFVPARILWENWNEFMGEKNVGNFTQYTIPKVTGIQAAVGSIYDHMGLPVAQQLAGGASLDVNALPLRAYNKIWNDWFRDQNLQAMVSEGVSNGPDANSAYTILKRNKSHDYFTSALPWPQKVSTGLAPVLGGAAPVLGIGIPFATAATAGPASVQQGGGAAGTFDWYFKAEAGSTFIKASADFGYPDVWADLGATTGLDLNTLRTSWLMQAMFETDARAGTRYVEIIRAHFGVTSPDFRLTRPEYIGGGQTPLIVTPIAQTAPTTGAPVGALGAAGVAAGTHRASYAATEHGYILGLINVRSELSYQRGVHKMWDRNTRYDFYWPGLAHLGEQAVLLRELYARGQAGNDNTIFGYQERWHEYRTRYSEVTGIMRSGVTGTLDAWHLAQDFASAPTLGNGFLADNPPMTRVLAAGALANGQQYLADLNFRRTAVRPIPMYGTPATLGRF